MRLSDFALSLVASPDLQVKLAPPCSRLVDDAEAMQLPAWPGRPDELRIRAAREARVPKMAGWPEPRLRARILHALANHELQAVELYARALLQFYDAPVGFRRDLLHVLLEEQRHTRAYIEALEAMGGRFGSLPVSGYFWRKVGLIDTPQRFVCVMSLTFENANLDHTRDSQKIAHRCGDEESARLFQAIHDDEIEHVRFGWRWLGRLKPSDVSMWEAFVAALQAPLHPGRATGQSFDPQPRRRAGLDEAFIDKLHRAHREKLARQADA